MGHVRSGLTPSAKFKEIDMKNLKTDREEVIDEMMKCDICRGYLAVCMVEPVRCPGLGIENGRYYVGRKGTSSFQWWDEILKEVKDRQEKERQAYFEANKEHLLKHGYIGGK